MEQFNSIAQVALWAAIATIGWFARQLWEAVKELKKDVHRIEIDLPTTYLSKSEFQEGVRQIREDLQIVFKRLDDIRAGR
jgi:hypothetical protein